MKRSIILDAGHGGKDPGAVGPTGLREKDVALSVVTRLGRLLVNAGLSVSYTRMDDRFLTLEERARMANERGLGLFLSVHCNSGPPGQGHGFEVFTTVGETAADAFATALWTAYGERLWGLARRADWKDGDPDKERDFAVLRLTRCPAALFELEFIHTPKGEAWLRDEAHHDAMAEGLCDGVLAHLGMAKPAAGETPTLPEEPDAPLLDASLLEIVGDGLAKMDEARERVAGLPDAELAALSGELARDGEINGAAGELWAMCLGEQAERWRKRFEKETA